MNVSLTDLLIISVGAVMLFGAKITNAENHHKELSDSAERAAEAAKDWRRNASDDFHEKQEAHNNERRWLRDELQREMRKLGNRASKEQIDEVVKRFKDDHSERIENEKKVAIELAAELKAGVPNAVPNEIREFRTEFTRVKVKDREARAAYKAQLELAASKEERDQLRDAFREEQRTTHRDLKEALKKIRTETRNGVSSGDRRVDQ